MPILPLVIVYIYGDMFSHTVLTILAPFVIDLKINFTHTITYIDMKFYYQDILYFFTRIGFNLFNDIVI